MEWNRPHSKKETQHITDHQNNRMVYSLQFVRLLVTSLISSIHNYYMWSCSILLEFIDCAHSRPFQPVAFFTHDILEIG